MIHLNPLIPFPKDLRVLLFTPAVGVLAQLPPSLSRGTAAASRRSRHPLPLPPNPLPLFQGEDL